MDKKVKTNANFANEGLVIVPPPPARFTMSEWYLNNRVKYRWSEDQQQLADRTLIECARIREKTAELAISNKNETNHCIEERISQIEFRKKETEKQRKQVMLEIDAMLTYKERIMDAMASIKDEALRICKKCIIMREGRIGIDLVHDDVEKELHKEVEVIEGAQILLVRTLEQTNESIRRCRSTVYFIDRELEHKMDALKIDTFNKNLNEHSLNLSIYHGTRPLEIANITVEEWETITNENFFSAGKEITSAIAIRSYIDILLKQIIEDLWNQYHIVNEAFRRRIAEIKEAKTKLELQHYEIARLVNEMMRNITQIEKAIADKENYMALAHTRLGNRGQRPGLELTRDAVGTSLLQEIKELHENIAHLQGMICEAQASMRYLLKNQVQLEEDINVKSNSLKIDEVDCMTLRQSIDYHAY